MLNKTQFKTEKILSRKKTKKTLASICLALMLGVLGGSFAANDMLNKKIDSISVEVMDQAKEILNTIKNQSSFNDYISNYKYSDEMYQQDLKKMNNFDKILLEGYKKYLKINNYYDERNDNDILKYIKTNETNYYFNLFNNYFYKNDEQINFRSMFIYFSTYHTKNNKNFNPYKEENKKIYSNEFKKMKNEVVYKEKNKNIFDLQLYSNINNYFKEYKADRNIIDFQNGDMFEKSNYTNYKKIKELKEKNKALIEVKINKLKNSSKSDDDFKSYTNELNYIVSEYQMALNKLYNEEVFFMLSDEITLKESLRIMRAKNELYNHFFELKKNQFKGGMIANKIIMPVAISMEEKIIKGNLSRQLNILKNWDQSNELLMFKNDEDLKLELSGFYDRE